MSDSLILGVPSKGRLEQNVRDFFARAGLKLTRPRGERDYRGLIAGLEGVEIAYLAASEIARELAAGKIHLGVTGEDLIHETIPDVDAKTLAITRLGFGEARVVVAVPRAWIDVDTMSDLDDVASSFRLRHGRRLRVATKYIRLTRAYFARHDISDYRIVESLGATEGAPAAGAAECIVDITTTGQTLAANALKILDDGEVLASEAALFAARLAPWTEASRTAMRLILDRVAAEARARDRREIRCDLALDDFMIKAVGLQFGAHPPFGNDTMPTCLHVPTNDVFRLVAYLQAQGATTVTVSRVDYSFSDQNRLWKAVEGRL